MLSGDDSGSSDPFAEVFFYGKKTKSKVLFETLNPIWNEKLELDAAIVDFDYAPPILIKVFDKDENSQEALGRVLIDIKEGLAKGYITYTQKEKGTEFIKVEAAAPQPVWLNVNYGAQH